MLEDIWDSFWRDRRGRVVIWQTPNVWLISWAALTFLSLLISGKMADVLTWVASTALLIWSALEITRGANYFRRTLGLVVFIFAVKVLLKSL